MKTTIALALALTPAGAAQAEDLVIRGARVFDGTGEPAQVKDVLVRGENIVAVGRVKPRRDARVIDGTGMTLIPGMNDLHIHTRSEAFTSPEALKDGYAPYLAHGVTTVNEYSVSGPMLAGIRVMKDVPTPHLNLAVRLGVPHGHGTESNFTNGITTQVTTPEEARRAMPGLLAYKPDVFKVFADGWRYGDPERPDRPSMDLPTLTEIVRQAHRKYIPVVTHTVTLEGAKTAARAGVDAVVHGVGDLPVDDELITLMKRHGTAYVPTMAVYEPQDTRTFLPEEWAKLSDKDREREEKRRAAPPVEHSPHVTRRWATLQDNLRRMKGAGVKVGIGTDTGIGGVYQGSATIRELRLFTDAGYTPAEVLTTATSGSAAIMHQKTHGRIAKGQHADLVLVAGRPDERIEDIYAVRRVFVSGREITPLPMGEEVQVPSFAR